MASPYASYDVLATANYLRQSLGSLGPEEAHLFSYMSCLLFLYSGQPAAEWGYSFSATPSGAPYSPAVEEAEDFLRMAGFLRKEGQSYLMTERGAAEYEELSVLSHLNQRDQFVEAACASALAVPVGLLRRAVSSDPQISAAGRLGSKRSLFDETDLGGLYESLRAVRNAIGEDTHDLLSPAVVWISYFADEERAT